MALLRTYLGRTVLLCAGLALAGCSATSKSDRPRYDGVAFRTSAKALNKKVSLAKFQVVVRDALRAPEGARKAAHHEGTTYCITNYGLSDIRWTVDPLDPETELVLSGKDAVYQGTCDG